MAIDGAPCSDGVLEQVASRPWLADSEIEVDQAPIRVLRAERVLAVTGIPVRGQVLDGDPEHAIIDEAERWDADLIVMGSHGFGPGTPRDLGPISNGVALHAYRSVEIVRCPHAAVEGHAVPDAARSARAASRCVNVRPSWSFQRVAQGRRRPAVELSLQMNPSRSLAR